MSHAVALSRQHRVEGALGLHLSLGKATVTISGRDDNCSLWCVSLPPYCLWNREQLLLTGCMEGLGAGLVMRCSQHEETAGQRLLGSTGGRGSVSPRTPAVQDSLYWLKDATATWCKVLSLQELILHFKIFSILDRLNLYWLSCINTIIYLV